MEETTLGGGCFWCLEAAFVTLRGVEKVVSGYSGGTVPDPSYQAVCSGTTGHAEVVQVRFDPMVLAFKDLLEVFFTLHDPTTLNRQGADVGTQYRSVIFYHSPEQKNIANEMMNKINAAHIWENPIVTELTPLSVFFRAEDYHQAYYEGNAGQPYCQVVITPKLEKLRRLFLSKLKR
ncbi:MAG: peptide-methionine (S)-S-oxide reductase MsrA [Nitrospiria bacterium]